MKERMVKNEYDPNNPKKIIHNQNVPESTFRLDYPLLTMTLKSFSGNRIGRDS